MIPLLVFTVAFIPRVLAARNIDMTWDEGLYAMNGMIALRNVATRNFSASAWGFEFHPPVMMYLFGAAYGLYVLIKAVLKGVSLSLDSLYREAINGFAGRQPLTVIRLPSIILGSLSSVVVYFLCLKLFGSQTLGIFASLFLALTPFFIAWSTLAMLESGVAFFYLLTIWSLLEAIGQSSPLFAVLSGIALGLTFGTRETGFLLPLVVLPWLGATTIENYAIGGYGEVFRIGQLVLIWLLSGIVVFYAAWPWLWRNPLKQLMKNLRATSKMESGGGWSLYFVSLLVSTPISQLFLYGAGFLWALYEATTQIESLLLLSWIFLPLIWMSLPFVPKRGGHIIVFILPPLSIVGALAIEEMSIILAGLFGVVMRNLEITLFLGLLFTVLLLLSCKTAHPYYHNYYNFIARTSDKGNSVVLLGWWGEGMGEAMSYIDKNAPPNTTVWVYGPKATAFYHSARVNLARSLKGENLLHEWGKVGNDVEVDESFCRWREGDLKFYFPYYHHDTFNNFTPTKLKTENVSYIVVYRWATYPQKVTAVDSGNNHVVYTLRNHRTPAFTVKISGIDVCWVYRIDNSND